LIGYDVINEDEKEDFGNMCRSIGGEHSDRHGVNTQKCELDGKELHVKDDLSKAKLVTYDTDESSAYGEPKDSQAKAHILGVKGVRLGHGMDNREALVVDGSGNDNFLKLVGGD
jgi:hypothetical protein